MKESVHRILASSISKWCSASAKYRSHEFRNVWPSSQSPAKSLGFTGFANELTKFLDVSKECEEHCDEQGLAISTVQCLVVLQVVLQHCLVPQWWPLLMWYVQNQIYLRIRRCRDCRRGSEVSKRITKKSQISCLLWPPSTFSTLKVRVFYCKGNPRFGHLSRTSRGDPKCYWHAGIYKWVTNLVGVIQRENSKGFHTRVLHYILIYMCPTHSR